MTPEDIAELNEDALLADGFDAALVGITSKGCAVYSIDAIIAILMERDGLDEEEANEFFGFNIECVYLGDFMPVYVQVGD
jgi:hypothetical protein